MSESVKKLAATVSNLAARVRNLYGQGPATGQQIADLARDLELAATDATALGQKNSATQLSNFALQTRNLFAQSRFTRQAIEYIAQDLEKEAKALDAASDPEETGEAVPAGEGVEKAEAPKGKKAKG